MLLLKKFKPEKILIFLITISVGFFLFDFFLTYLGTRYNLWESSKAFVKFYELFGLTVETSLPTLFSIINLLFSSVLLWLIAKKICENKEEYKNYWIILSVIFLFLALDQGTGIHNVIGKFINSFLNFPRGHPLYYSWVLPYTILIIIGGLLYLKFLFSLPRGIRIGIIASGLLVVIGALGIDFVESIEIGKVSRNGFVHTYNFDRIYIIASVEELMEMVGISLFNYVLLIYIALRGIKIEFSVESGS